MDGVDPDVIGAARDAAKSVAGVEDVRVRARWMGRSLLLEIDAVLDDDVLLGHADRLDSRVEAAVFEAVPAARRVQWRPTSRFDLMLLDGFKRRRIPGLPGRLAARLTIAFLKAVSPDCSLHLRRGFVLTEFQWNPISAL